MIPLSDSAHKPGRFPLINIALILANIFVFFMQLTTSDPEGFIYTYALVPSQIDFSNPATLYPFITSMFLHGGFLHIISNMLFLWVFGDNVEGDMNSLTYLFLYLFSGIVGSLAQYFMNPTSSIPMLGASGAVAGVLGAYFILFPNHKIKTLIPFFGFFTIAEISATIMIGYWIVLQVISGFLLSSSAGPVDQGGIAFFAHIGGFFAGAVLAKLLPKTQRVQLRE
jgi:membrane associated rhomboid family serine protease